jgi:hypothetical protein
MQVGRTTIITGGASGIAPAYVRSEHWLAGVVRMQATLETEEQS